MNLPKALIYSLLFACLLLPPPSQGAAPPASNQRLALVIGNGAYTESPLKNPVNDARDMAKVLAESGFTVILKTDADKRTMDEAIQDFGKKLMSGGVGLFFYAGHGIQVAGANYLIPVAAEIESESDVRYNGVDAGHVLGKMEDAGNEVNIVILDACRDNPFGKSFRSGSRGLAKMDSPKGSLIAYATAPGSVAADGKGQNGVFTKHLLRYLGEPGLKVTDALDQVRVAVVEETNKQQVPWTASSLMGNFYFNADPATDTPGQGTTANPALAETTTPRGLTADREALFWDSVKENPDATGFELYLKRYPEGEFAELAQLKIEQLKAKNTPSAAAKPKASPTPLPEKPATAPATDLAALPLEVPPPVTPVLPKPTIANSTDAVTGMEFQAVTGGCFQMGDNFGDGLPPEKPVHEVCVGDFSIGKFEVTQGQWQAVMVSNPASSKGEQNPVENVSWVDVQNFLERLNQQTGKAYRLPTEAEWEYACRSGGKQEKYCGGADKPGNLAWLKDNSKGLPHPVGKKQANSLGLYDMSGNVWEWCADWFEADYYATSARQNPTGPTSGTSRIFRGGGWNGGQWVARSASRNGDAPTFRGPNLGFRVVFTPEKP